MNYLLKELPALVDAGVINEDTAENIRQYYNQKSDSSSQRLVMVFSILGALLVGLGIILIIAHNWDDLSKGAKIVCALAPMIISQSLCAVALVRHSGSRTWREASSTSLIFSIAAAIAIVSQVYHMHGDLSRFLIVWMVLSIPVIYVMHSRMASLLVICGITWYAVNESYLDYFSFDPQIAWYYWLMLAAVIPFYILLLRKERRNFFYYHTWFIVISVTIGLGMFGESGEQWLYVGYMALFCIFILTGSTAWFSESRLIANGFLVAGSMGVAIILISLGFEWNLSHGASIQSGMELYVSLAVFLIASALLLYHIRRNGPPLNMQGTIFIPFSIIFFLGYFQPELARVLVNLLLLVTGILIMRHASRANSLFTMNYGLALIAALIVSRFLDDDITFVIRGLIFIAVGIGFFAANFWILRKKRLAKS
ncbi:MAG TPA: DUF2157 domain-containing protein [Chryseosolibacter sp.]|nr:DUF2157 domain-containing protein [Chryseosolibacter sp.]